YYSDVDGACVKCGSAEEQNVAIAVNSVYLALFLLGEIALPRRWLHWWVNGILYVQLLRAVAALAAHSMPAFLETVLGVVCYCAVIGKRLLNSGLGAVVVVGGM